MNLDILTQFSNAQTITAGAGATASTNSYDGAASQGMLTGIGEPMEVIVFFNTNGGITGGTISLIADDDNAGTNSFTAAIWTLTATPVAGSKIVLDIPASDDKLMSQALPTTRFYHLSYDLTGAATCTVTAYLQPDEMVQNQNIYPKSGYQIK